MQNGELSSARANKIQWETTNINEAYTKNSYEHLLKSFPIANIDCFTLSALMLFLLLLVLLRYVKKPKVDNKTLLQSSITFSTLSVLKFKQEQES